MFWHINISCCFKIINLALSLSLMPPYIYLVIGRLIALPRYDSGHLTQRKFILFWGKVSVRTNGMKAR
jgi:hypothetical protein